MNGDITEDPLARAVLRHLAAPHSGNEPLGSLARTVLNGEASLRAAANHPWHSQALAAAAQAARAEQNRMSAEERADMKRAADRLRTQRQVGNDDLPGRKS
jgi:hypothetical protein